MQKEFNNKLDILYEDKNLLVVDKPAGILVYPLKKSRKKELTLIDIIYSYLGYEPSLKDQRKGLVHRLDRETSGVIIFAKNDSYEKELKKIFKERKIRKFYKVLVWGNLDSQEGIIKIPLGRGHKDRLKMVPKYNGRHAETHFKVEKYFPNDDMSLLDVEIKTGRTHQIRVHFSSLNHSVVGDKKYSHRRTSLKRQFLHAQRLVFRDPDTQKIIDIYSPLHKDLSDFLKTLS